MHLQNQRYTVTAHVETMPSLAQFDIVHNPNHTNTDDFYNAQVFRVESIDAAARTIALLDLLCAGYEPFAVLEMDCLTVILFDSIVRINLSTGLITEMIECDNMGGLHEIHAIPDGYIIWGEGDIFRYDLQLNRKWHFMGRDILVSLDKDKHFWIKDDLIHCRDFLGWHYVLDFDGNLLHNFQECNIH